MSKSIRKIKKQVRETSSYQDLSLKLYATEYEGIIACNIIEAKNCLSLYLYANSYEYIKPGQRHRVDDREWRLMEPYDLVIFSAADQPHWAPEDDEEEDNPPYYELQVKEVLESYVEGIVYCKV